jgi:hypothetical protein
LSSVTVTTPLSNRIPTVTTSPCPRGPSVNSSALLSWVPPENMPHVSVAVGGPDTQV